MEVVWTFVLMAHSHMCKILSWSVQNVTSRVWHVLAMQLPALHAHQSTSMSLVDVWRNVVKGSMSTQKDYATLVTHPAKIAMKAVQVPAQNVQPKITRSYFYTRVNARLLVQVVSSKKQQVKSVNLVIQPVTVALVRPHRSACPVVRGFSG